MTLIAGFIASFTDGMPVMVIIIAILCDTAIILTLALTGVIHG